VWAIWRLGREVANDREGLLAALLLTVSYQHVWFSQNARGYSGLLFWALLSSALLVRALRGRSPSQWGAYAVAVTLGMATHLTMLFVSLGQFVAWLWTDRREVRRARLQPFVTGFALSGLLTLLVYSLVLPQIPGANATDVSDVATWRSPLWAVRETLVGLQLTGLGGITLVVGAAVIGIGLGSYWCRSPVLPIVFVVPVVVGGAITIASGHHLWPRFFFFAAGFGILVVVRGLDAIAQWLAARLRTPWLAGPRLSTAITILLALTMARGLPWAYRPKQDYAGARDFVRADLRPGDTVVVAGVAALAYGRYYAPEWRTVRNADELTAARRPAGRTWLLCTLPIALRAAHPDMVALLERDFTLVREFEGSLSGGNILVYRANPATLQRGH
jgi:mannosyltransferase